MRSKAYQVVCSTLEVTFRSKHIIVLSNLLYTIYHTPHVTYLDIACTKALSSNLVFLNMNCLTVSYVVKSENERDNKNRSWM